MRKKKSYCFYELVIREQRTAIELITRLFIRLVNVFVKSCFHRTMSLYTQVFNLSSMIISFFFSLLIDWSIERILVQPERKREGENKSIIFKIKCRRKRREQMNKFVALDWVVQSIGILRAFLSLSNYPLSR